ncbi:hypothetical protein M501DRAFT_937899 [Patellaria atrata CBS 101060]|uniref:GATA-type domain-containing protein n=1 Tax=Patellaria atrata CBS 101060 TaxID=1346257 RepID=A0A9P4S754_9PEZI|nr:hypothetical protein M501DRAFT_937899 [Patellaria atrata CBS 101060]
MTYATAAPAATPAGQGNAPPICQNCTTSTTPLWRRDEVGSVLCNACGLFLKLHGRPRPISLKTDVIKSRNRVKTAGQPSKKRISGDGNGNGLAAAHPDGAIPPNHFLHRGIPGPRNVSGGLSDRSNSPVSRTGTPAHHPSNIAPQHLFDGVTLNGHADMHNSPSLPTFPSFNFRQPSPSASSINGSHLEPPATYEALKTRVAELEVINNLFRERVAELEASEQDARRNELMARETESKLRSEIDESQTRETELKRRVEELEAEVGPKPKRMKMSEMVNDSRAGTPLSNRSLSPTS